MRGKRVAWKQLELFRGTATEIRRLERQRSIEELKAYMKQRRAEEEAEKSAHAIKRSNFAKLAERGHAMPICVP